MYQKDLFLWPILFYACYVSACALKSFGLLRKSLPLCGLYEFPTHTCKGFRLFIAFLTELYFCHGKKYADNNYAWYTYTGPNHLLHHVYYFLFLIRYFICIAESVPSTELIAPSIQMEHEISVPIQEGDTVTFVCKVGGNPEPRLVFYKDNKRLRANENIFIGKNEK